MQKVAGERYVYKFVCNPEALFQVAAGADHHRNSGAGHGSGGGSGQCSRPGSDQGSGNSGGGAQFCHVLNTVYPGHTNYGHYYDGGAGGGGGGGGHQAGQTPVSTDQKCVSDYLAAYRHSHKQHYIQVSRILDISTHSERCSRA